jgi:DtxR family Mn-dependent transcriptional regulator
MELSISEENYIKAVYTLEVKNEVVNTNNIAEKMQTRASSVTDMLRRLADKNLVHYIKYRGVSLTETGRAIALQTIRKHRLWEVFLVEKLHFTWDEVHDVAEQLEHIRSQKLTEQLAAYLKFPDFDPHGDPIPDSFGNMPQHSDKTLNQCRAGEHVVLQRVRDGNPAFLQYLERINLTPGEAFHVRDILDFDHSVEVIRQNGQSLLLSETVAKNLFVRTL